jgi:hypothetical protein
MRRINYDADYMQTKEYRIESVKYFITYEHRDLFEEVAADTIKRLKTKIQNQEEKITELYTRVSNDSISKEYEINDDPLAQIRDLKWDKDRNNEQMYALNEMRIIYLFKHFETGMKLLVNIAYPETSSKDLYNLHKEQGMKSFWAKKKINLSELDGNSNNEITQLRDLSNTLKHGSIQGDIWQIPEFVAPYNFFHSGNMESFYLRIQPAIDLFQKSLAKAIMQTLANN